MIKLSGLSDTESNEHTKRNHARAHRSCKDNLTDAPVTLRHLHAKTEGDDHLVCEDCDGQIPDGRYGLLQTDTQSLEYVVKREGEEEGHRTCHLHHNIISFR